MEAVKNSDMFLGISESTCIFRAVLLTTKYLRRLLSLLADLEALHKLEVMAKERFKLPAGALETYLYTHAALSQKLRDLFIQSI